MTTAATGGCIARIGKAAGTVWTVLAAEGPLSMTRLVKATGEPHDVAMQALGWLAREDKILIEEKGRSRFVSLK